MEGFGYISDGESSACFWSFLVRGCGQDHIFGNNFSNEYKGKCFGYISEG